MKKKKNEEPAGEWDLSKGIGILPDGISLTQNIGCVGSKNEKPNSKIKNKK